MRLLIPALGICAGAAVLEAVLAGQNVKQRFSQLRMPRLSPSLTVWILIGAAYYLICCVVIFRLLTLPPSNLRAVGWR